MTKLRLLAISTLLALTTLGTPAVQVSADPISGPTYIPPEFFGHHLHGFEEPNAKYIPSDQIPSWSVKHIRIGVPHSNQAKNTFWCGLNPAPNEYRWGALDEWLEQAKLLGGAEPSYLLGLTPVWVTGGPADPAPQCNAVQGALAPPLDRWRTFIDRLVTRSLEQVNGRPKIKHYELWNEFDGTTFWAGTVDQMAAMADAAAEIIHARDPDAKVLTPSVTSYVTGIDCTDGLNCLRELFERVDNSATDGDPRTFDVVNVHTYSSYQNQSGNPGGREPEQSLGDGTDPITYTNRLKSMMVAMGYRCVPNASCEPGQDRPIVSTESGWGSNAGYPNYASDAAKRAFVAKYSLLMITNGYSRMVWYAYANAGSQQNPNPSGWGTLFDPFVCPPLDPTCVDLPSKDVVTEAGKAMAETYNWLAGATLTSGCSKASGVWTCDITRPGGYVGRVVWADIGATPPQYSTSGFATLRTLDGSPPISPPPSLLSLTNEPVLLQN